MGKVRGGAEAHRPSDNRPKGERSAILDHQAVALATSQSAAGRPASNGSEHLQMSLGLRGRRHMGLQEGSTQQAQVNLPLQVWMLRSRASGGRFPGKASHNPQERHLVYGGGLEYCDAVL
jgi:hypothetical protein